jgi:hypothetical protein
MSNQWCTMLALIFMLGGMPSMLQAQDYSPFVGKKLNTNVYFGDTHLHSSRSTDAGMGGAKLGPEEAFRAALGERVVSHTGLAFQLHRPLDFLVLADHAENQGLADFIRVSDPLILNNPKGKQWHDLVQSGQGYKAFLEWLRADNVDLINEPRLAVNAWKQQTDVVESFYRPGVFTTLHGFEWTSHPGGNNLHRVVIFRDGKDKAQQILPYSQYDSIDPEELWRYMEGYESRTGGRVLAIPHNSNLSNGMMFDIETLQGKAFDFAYATRRAHFEPLVEITQMKGTSEAHPFLSPEDTFADYELLDHTNLSGKAPKTADMLTKEYAREALKTGLLLEAKIGANPYQFGVIGSTDSHTGLPSAREDNNFGKAHIAEPDATRVNRPLIQAINPELSMMVKDLGASGLAAVWAEDNTREAIFDAMMRKETYATTGSRMTVRVFAGWGLNAADLDRPDWVDYAYQRGVPMGGQLVTDQQHQAPGMLIVAQRDPDGANLDRIQVVKGWLDDNGKTHERIYDVAVSDGRLINAKGVCDTPVGSSVDLDVPSYSNSIGDPRLQAFWRDPDFDPRLSAFYYVRVIEIPVPRWTAYDRVKLGAVIPEGTAMTVQDRAYTSPIWVKPH